MGIEEVRALARSNFSEKRKPPSNWATKDLPAKKKKKMVPERERNKRGGKKGND